MILLTAEQAMAAAEIAVVVRQDEETVRRWFTHYRAEGIEGLSDVPRSSAPRGTAPRGRLVLPYLPTCSPWLNPPEMPSRGNRRTSDALPGVRRFESALLVRSLVDWLADALGAGWQSALEGR